MDCAKKGLPFVKGLSDVSRKFAEKEYMDFRKFHYFALPIGHSMNVPFLLRKDFHLCPTCQLKTIIGLITTNMMVKRRLLSRCYFWKYNCFFQFRIKKSNHGCVFQRTITGDDLLKKSQRMYKNQWFVVTIPGFLPGVDSPVLLHRRRVGQSKYQNLLIEKDSK